MGIQQNYNNPFYNNYSAFGNGSVSNVFAQQQQIQAAGLSKTNVGEAVGRTNKQQQQPEGVMSSIGFIPTDNPQAILEAIQFGAIPRNIVVKDNFGQNLSIDQFAALLQQLDMEKLKRENEAFQQKLTLDTLNTVKQNADSNSYDAQYLAELNEEINGIEGNK